MTTGLTTLDNAKYVRFRPLAGNIPLCPACRREPGPTPRTWKGQGRQGLTTAMTLGECEPGDEVDIALGDFGEGVRGDVGL